LFCIAPVGKEIRERFSGAVEAFSTKRVSGSSQHDNSRNKGLDNVSPYLYVTNHIFLLESKLSRHVAFEILIPSFVSLCFSASKISTLRLICCLV